MEIVCPFCPTYKLPCERNVGCFLAKSCESVDDPSRPAITDSLSGVTLSFANLAKLARRVAAKLRHLIDESERERLPAAKQRSTKTVIAVLSTNCLEYVLLQIATGIANIIELDVSYNYLPDELERAFQQSDVDFIIVQTQFASSAKAAFNRCPRIQAIFDLNKLCEFTMSGEAAYVSIATKDSSAVNVSIRQKQAHKDGSEVNDLSDVYSMVMSSGTTGLPKTVLTPHSVKLAAITNFCAHVAFDSPGKDDVLLACAPIYHTYGSDTVLAALAHGCHVVTMPKFERQPFLENIQKYKVTHIYTAPPVVAFLAESEAIASYDLSSLRNIWSSAAALSPKLAASASARLPNVSIRQLYGMSEINIVLCATHGMRNFASVGVPVPGVTCKIIDQTSGHSLGPDQIGELCVRGPSCCPGYYRNEKATKEFVDKDGWRHTGDLFYYDNKSNFFCVGRIKEILKYNGIQISVAEIESVISEYPGVADCAIVGKPDPVAGELPTALVVRESSSNVAAAAINDLVKAKLSYHKQLRGGIYFVDQIPRNAMGKIQRKQVTEMLSELCSEADSALGTQRPSLARL